MNDVKLHNTALILDETLTTIQVVYNQADLHKPHSKTWTYVMPQLRAKECVHGDIIVCESGPFTHNNYKLAGDHALVLAFYVSCNKETTLDLDAPFPYLFAFDRVLVCQLEALRATQEHSVADLRKRLQAKHIKKLKAELDIVD